ncbi:MAG: VIT1/CCC1 transporter family protein [Reyranella sp.]|nr:VIT1/CCC1 transporter family protein [Reyranella sp.]
MPADHLRSGHSSCAPNCRDKARYGIAVALLVSVAITGVALLIFGGIKARLTSVPIARGAFETVLVGGLAAGIAFLVARLIG